MKFHEYIESTYVSTNIDVQIKYCPYLQAKTQSAQNLLYMQKWFYRQLAYFALVFHYTLIVLGRKEAPPLAQDLVKSYNKKPNE